MVTVTRSGTNNIGRRVLILGAGSAGLAAAFELEKVRTRLPGLKITVVDQHNYHLFLPLLYQVVTGGVEPGHITFPVRSLIRGTQIEFREAAILSIDPQKKIVATDKGELECDYLVIAPGSVTDFRGMAEVEEHALPLKTLQHGIAMHNHILDCYEAALWESDDVRRELLTFVIVGGGATGVELTASIQNFVSKVMIRDYPSIKKEEVRVILAEARGEVLGEMGSKMSRMALSKLQAQGSEVMLNTRIAHAWERGVQTAEGLNIPCCTLIWVAGVKPIRAVADLPLEKSRDGRIVVTPQLEAPKFPGVYILGDCAYLKESPAVLPLPPTGQVAVQQGIASARMIARALRGLPPQPFNYHHRGDLISMGRNKALAHLDGLVFNGFPAWLVWRTYYFSKLMGFRNRLSVALDWSFAYFYRRNTARLE